MKKLKPKKNSFAPLSTCGRSFTIIELMVAIFVILVGLIGGMTAISRMFILTSLSSSRLTAAYLAQEGIEIVRNIRDSNWLETRTATTTPWDEGLSNCSGGCEADYTILGVEDPSISTYFDRKLKINPDDGFYSYTSGDETKFKREITINHEGNNVLNIVVEVTWQEKGQSYSFSVQEKLYNWW